VAQLVEGKEGGEIPRSNQGEDLRPLLFPREGGEGGGEGGIQTVI